MKKYKITITESLKKELEIEAVSKDEAMDLVKEKYKNEEIILTADDFADVDFKVKEARNRNRER